MKSLFHRIVLISSMMICLFSSSCKKDIAGATGCVQCDTITSGDKNSYSLTFNLNEDAWVKQNDGSYTCDLTKKIIMSDAFVSQVYEMAVMNEGVYMQIFPGHIIDLYGGALTCTVSGPNHLETCALTFSYLNGDRFYGEVPNGGKLPFSSIAVRVYLLK